jgi:hypothetical protein
MSVQFHIAYSSVVSSAAIFAGGPYWCAQGSIIHATVDCMNVPASINIDTLVAKAKSLASSGSIDALSNLDGHSVFLFSGTKDSVVNPRTTPPVHSP